MPPLILLLVLLTIEINALQQLGPSKISTELEDTIPQRDTCQPITWTVCMDVRYNETTMPNSLGHNTQVEAGIEMYHFMGLVDALDEKKCSPDLQLFVCSVYLPVCVLGQPLPPCRSICLSSKNGCEGILEGRLLNWPKFLDCDRFPDGSEVPCVGTDQATATTLPDNSTKVSIELEDEGSLHKNGSSNSTVSVFFNFSLLAVFYLYLNLRC